MCLMTSAFLPYPDRLGSSTTRSDVCVSGGWIGTFEACESSSTRCWRVLFFSSSCCSRFVNAALSACNRWTRASVSDWKPLIFVFRRSLADTVQDAPAETQFRHCLAISYADHDGRARALTYRWQGSIALDLLSTTLC